jgi:hypothetical protein
MPCDRTNGKASSLGLSEDLHGVCRSVGKPSNFSGLAWNTPEQNAEMAPVWHPRLARRTTKQKAALDETTPQTNAECSVPGCGRPAIAKGLCNPHYQRLRVLSTGSRAGGAAQSEAVAGLQHARRSAAL